MMTQVRTDPPLLSGLLRPLRIVWWLLGVLLILRLLVGARLELAPDEAVYWSWSRHLYGGYLDHPPLIAWINWLSTHILGSTQLGVRLPAALLAFGMVALLVMLARRLMPDWAAAWVGLMWLLGPLLTVIGTISTPDTPVVFFSTAALTCVALIALRDDERMAGEGMASNDSPSAGLWILFGIFCGVALLAKYTAVLLPAAVFVALVSSPAGRRHLRRPWIYLAALVALVIFSPVLVWNARHGWASFAYQLHHGTGGDEAAPPSAATSRLDLLRPFINTAAYIGGQAAVWTPILFALVIVVLVSGWRRYGRLNHVDRLLLCCASVPLLIFGLASVRKVGEVNWPMFTYVPASLLIGRRLAQDAAGRWRHWVWEGCKLALIFTIGLHLLLMPGSAKLLARVHIRIPHNVLDVTGGWQRFGNALGRVADGAPAICNRHQDAGEAAFYMPGQPDVWCDSVASRITAFDFFDGPPDYRNIPRVLFVGGHVSAFATKHGYAHWKTVPLGIGDANGKGERTATIMWR